MLLLQQVSVVVCLQVESYKDRRWSGVAGVVKVLLEWC
jgi:hypothetical protein